MNTFYPIYNREDVIARDLTGSGKTLAFALPVTEYLRKNKLLGIRKITAIVLAPTRELAIQVSVDAFLKLWTKFFFVEWFCVTFYFCRFKMSLVDLSTTQVSSTHWQSMVVSQWMIRLESSEEELTSLLAQQVVSLTILREATLTFRKSGQLFLTKLTKCSNSALKRMSNA